MVNIQYRSSASGAVRRHHNVSSTWCGARKNKSGASLWMIGLRLLVGTVILLLAASQIYVSSLIRMVPKNNGDDPLAGNSGLVTNNSTESTIEIPEKESRAICLSYTYSIPQNNKTDPVTSQRVEAAFGQLPRKEEDLGWQASLNRTGYLCDVTSKIVLTREICASEPADTSSNINNQEEEWILSTFTRSGILKRIGGDEIYVTYTDIGQREPTAVAEITDLHNGNYSLKFVQSPTLEVSSTTTMHRRHGTMTVILEQSCGMAHIAPPLKQNWTVSGAINQFYKLNNVSSPINIDPFQAPNRDGAIDLSKFKSVVLLGDSLIEQFVCRAKNCAVLAKPSLQYTKVQAALNSQTLDQSFLVPMRRVLNGVMKNPEISSSNKRPNNLQPQNETTITQQQQQLSTLTTVALVLGSGVWDILADDESAGGKDYEDHLLACRTLVHSAQTEFPSVSIYWKSMTAMHLHEVANGNPSWSHIKRGYYMSNARARRLYDVQVSLMRELGIPVLDLFPFTYFAAHKTRKGDGRHYEEDFNQLMLSYFYPATSAEESDRISKS